MKKIMLVPLVLSLLVVTVLAQPLVASTANVKVRALAILGKGIAANPDDAMDFMIVKFGIGKVRYNITGAAEDKTIGVLKLDDVLYRLRDVVIGDGKATGDIYKNGSLVGSFDVSSVMKGDTEIWAGTMSIDGSTYNVYVIEGVRPIKASELKERVVEYCKNNEDANCRDRLRDYCENNPNDRRCKALFRAYCLKSDNMDDTRCRQVFKEWCEKNPRNAHCVPFALQRAKSYCEEHSDSTLCKRIANHVVDFCKDNPDNKGCARVKQIVEERPKLLENVQALRNRISSLEVRVQTIEGTITSADVEGGD